MSRKNTFEFAKPRSVHEAVSILLEAGNRAALLAGGTDLLVKMKRSLRLVDVIVDLSAIPELSRVEPRQEGLWIGSMMTANSVATDGDVGNFFPAISKAARRVGALQVRNMATLGGALCSGLRCQFRDQSEFYRASLGVCAFDGGDACFARPNGGCCATVACDLAPALVANDAILHIQGEHGHRELRTDAFFTGDAMRPYRLGRGELLLGALLPWSKKAPQWLGSYNKVRLRRAVDRPLIGLATCLELDEFGHLRSLRIAACGHGPAAQLVPGLDVFLGARLELSLADAIGRAVSRWFSPTPAIRIDASWRKAISGVITRRSLLELLNESQPTIKPHREHSFTHLLKE